MLMDSKVPGKVVRNGFQQVSTGVGSIIRKGDVQLQDSGNRIPEIPMQYPISTPPDLSNLHLGKVFLFVGLIYCRDINLV
jgi:hypothetical protein